MAVSEQDRHRLYTRIAEVLGDAEAATLMEHLPPVGWSDVATKADVEHQGAALRAEMAVLRGDLEHLGTSLRAEMEHLGTSLRLEMQAMEHRILGTMERRMADQTRTFALAMVAGQVSTLGLLVAYLQTAA